MQKTSFAHIRPASLLFGGFTLAYTGNEETVEIAFAFCSKSERYVRRVGREIALARFNAGRTIKVDASAIPKVSETRGSDIIDHVLNNLDTYKAQLTKPYKSKN